VLIVADTFRRDNLGCYGNTRVRTPNLDGFAQKSVIFDNCYECSFPTMPTRADLFTGRWTFTNLGWEPLPSDEIVLAQVLNDAGYVTTAVVDTPFFLREGYGYDRGFFDFIYIRGQGNERRDVNLQRRYETDYCAPATMLEATRWLERHRKDRFFLYVDTWDPHEPWDPPSWYVEQYYPEFDGKHVDLKKCYWFWKEKGLTEEDLRKAYACYCGEVSMVDKWIGFLLDALEAMGLMEETAIIFTTDHGFYFGEHGIFGKAIIDHDKLPWKIFRSPLYEEVTHIPLLIHVPGVKPKRNEALVCLPDLMPTILDLLECDIPSTVQGKSLLPLLLGDVEESWDFVVTSWPLYNPGDISRAVDALEKSVKDWLPITVTTKEWTLLYSSEGQPVELYHLPTDPHQEKNVFEDKIDVARELHSKLISRLVEYNTPPCALEPRRRL